MIWPLSDSVDDKRGQIPTALEWATVRFYEYQKPLSSSPSTPSFDGLDKLLLLAWVRECFVETNYWNFSLNYWDLCKANVLFDDDLNIAGYPFITS
jgi:hypothetical protein